MDKEAQEKMAKYLYYQSTSSLSGVSWNALTDIEDKSGNISSTKRYWFKEAAQILVLIKELGYRKLPKDKPPLLNDKELRLAIAEGEEMDDYIGAITDGDRGIAQAQRVADIKWFEQKFLPSGKRSEGITLNSA